MPYYGPSGGGGGAAVVDASTTAKGIVELATPAEVLAAVSAILAVTPDAVVSAISETGLAKIQFIPNGGVVTGSPGPWTLIIEAGA